MTHAYNQGHTWLHRELKAGMHETLVLKSQKQQQQNAKKLSFQFCFVGINSWELLGLVVSLLYSSLPDFHSICFIGNSELSVISIS